MTVEWTKPLTRVCNACGKVGAMACEYGVGFSGPSAPEGWWVGYDDSKRKGERMVYACSEACAGRDLAPKEAR